MTLLRVENLTLGFDTDEGRVTAIDDVSFNLEAGEVMGLVGESGSGKSVLAKSLMQLNPGNAVYSPTSRITLRDDENGGEIDVLSLTKAQDLR